MRSGTTSWLGCALLLLSCSCGGSEPARIAAPSPRGGDGFGNALSVGPEAIYVGAWTRAGEPAVPGGGGVLVFERSAGAWGFARELRPSERVLNQRFGASLALQGHRLLVGSPGLFGTARAKAGESTHAGAVHVFEQTDGEWRAQALLRAADGVAGDSFGYSLALEDDLALVGAIGRAAQGPHAGAVYVFELADGAWRQVEVWTASDAQEGALFGHAVALSGDTALVGAHRDGEAQGLRRGAVYVFRRDEPAGPWREVQKLQAPGPAVKGRFGHSLDLEGRTAVIAERLRPPGGSVHVFTEGADRWQHDVTLRSPAPDAREFGWSVDLAAGELLVGDRRDSGDGEHAGAAHHFVRDDQGAWQWSETLRSTSPRGEGEFGLSGALGHGYAVVGAWKEDAGRPSSGAVHVFEVR